MSQRPTSSSLPLLLSILAVVFATAGNLLGNLLASEVPAVLTPFVIPAFLIAIGLYVGVSMLLSARQTSRNDTDDPMVARSRRQRVVTLVLLLADGVLATSVGVLSNLVANALPSAVKPYAPLLYLGVAIVTIAITLAQHWLSTNRRAQIHDHRGFLGVLQSLYAHQYNDAEMRTGGALIELALQARSLPPSEEFDRFEGTESEGTEGSGRSAADDSDQHVAAIARLFARAHGRAVLLGEPGSGKSTLLVALALDLLKRGQRDASSALPVIFNLATWGINAWETLDTWLVEELSNEPFNVEPGLATTWIAQGAITPLLDGLDEVSDPNLRRKCAQSIQTFLQQHPKFSTVVTCRSGEFASVQDELLLPHISLEPLTDEQIDAHFDRLGNDAAPLHATLRQNSSLRDAVRTPFLLSLIIETYTYLPADRIPEVTDLDGWKRQLFGDYVRQVTAHPSVLDGPWRISSPEKVSRYLAWLAMEMKNLDIVDFYVEFVNPDWLANQHTRARYLVGQWLVLVLFGTIFGALISVSDGVFANNLIDTVGLIAVIGAAIGFLASSSIATVSTFVKTLQHNRDRPWALTASVGVLSGLLVSASMSHAFDIQPALPSTCCSGVTFIIALVIIWNVLSDDDIGSLTKVGLSILGCVAATIATANIAAMTGLLTGGVVGWVSASPVYERQNRFSMAYRTRELSESRKRFSNAPQPAKTQYASSGVGSVIEKLVDIFWATQLIIIVLTIPISAIGGMVWLLTHGFAGYAVGSIAGISALCSSLIAAWMLRPNLNGATVLQWVCRSSGETPPRLQAFLDYATRHLLLQRVGRGYRFLHPTLRDYFADLEPTRRNSMVER